MCNFFLLEFVKLSSRYLDPRQDEVKIINVFRDNKDIEDILNIYIPQNSCKDKRILPMNTGQLYKYIYIYIYQIDLQDPHKKQFTLKCK